MKIQLNIAVTLTWKIPLFALILVYAISCTPPANPNNPAQKIVIETNISPYFYRQLQKIYSIKEQINIQYSHFPPQPFDSASLSITGKTINSKTSWILYIKTPIKITPPFGTPIIVHPGDSVHINYLYDYPIYTGKKTQQLKFLSELMKTEDNILKPRIKYSYNAHALVDFWEWNQYLDKKMALQDSIFEFYKDKIPLVEHEYYKATSIGSIENDRLNAFSALYDSVKAGYPNLTLSDLVTIWDSTQYKPQGQWLRSLSNYYASISNIHAFNRMEIFRRFGFDNTRDSLASKETRTSLYYHTAKEKYKGLMRERLLAFILDEQTITEMGITNPTTRALLTDYHSQPGYPEYKQLVKTLEEKQRIYEKEYYEKKKQKG